MAAPIAPAAILSTIFVLPFRGCATLVVRAPAGARLLSVLSDARSTGEMFAPHGTATVRSGVPEERDGQPLPPGVAAVSSTAMYPIVKRPPTTRRPGSIRAVLCQVVEPGVQSRRCLTTDRVANGPLSSAPGLFSPGEVMSLPAGVISTRSERPVGEVSLVSTSPRCSKRARFRLMVDRSIDGQPARSDGLTGAPDITRAASTSICGCERPNGRSAWSKRRPTSRCSRSTRPKQPSLLRPARRLGRSAEEFCCIHLRRIV